MPKLGEFLIDRYRFAKTIVIDFGYEEEIEWQENLSFDDIDERTFLMDLAWVILNSGISTSVIDNIFDDISECFFNWKSSEKIMKNEKKCKDTALTIFKNKGKINAIIDAAKIINQHGFESFKAKIEKNPLDTLRIFKFIGPTTVFHIAKNIGFPFAKPDRHLTRIALMENYSDVQQFCLDISNKTGDSVPVVDIVFWRFATIDQNYLQVLSSLNFQPQEKSMVET